MEPAAEFVRLWTRHQADVERYLFAIMPRANDVSEVLQNVSVALWEKWDKYEQQRPFIPWARKFAWIEVQKWRQRQAREKLVFSNELLEQLNAVYEDCMTLTDPRRQALEECMEKLNSQERKWLQLRYSKHGALKKEAEKKGIKMPKRYYALEKIRAGLLQCIGQTMKREGWSDA